jgi:hypothetical protein
VNIEGKKMGYTYPPQYRHALWFLNFKDACYSKYPHALRFLNFKDKCYSSLLAIDFIEFNIELCSPKIPACTWVPKL